MDAFGCGWANVETPSRCVGNGHVSKQVFPAPGQKNVTVVDATLQISPNNWSSHEQSEDPSGCMSAAAASIHLWPSCMSPLLQRRTRARRNQTEQSLATNVFVFIVTRSGDRSGRAQRHDAAPRHKPHAIPLGGVRRPMKNSPG
jgi:hypothetical protein